VTVTDFAMFTNEGNIAVAAKLTQVLNETPVGGGITSDELYARFSELCEADLEFCARHGEWSDTQVREIVYAWLDAPEALTVLEAVGTIEFGGVFHIKVPTLDGDADAVLEKRLDEIAEILSDAVESALMELDRRVGNTGQEWSGLEVDIL